EPAVVRVALRPVPAWQQAVRGARTLANELPAHLLRLGRHRRHRVPAAVCVCLNGNRHENQELRRFRSVAGLALLAAASRRSAYCPWLEAANSFWPVLDMTTDVAFPIGFPLLALKPSTVTTSPGFMELRVQPARSSPFGPPISIPQFVTLPPASF